MKNKNQTGLKNFKPNIKLNHNIYIVYKIYSHVQSHVQSIILAYLHVSTVAILISIVFHTYCNINVFDTGSSGS